MRKKIFAIAVALCFLFGAQSAKADPDWNDKDVRWYTYEDGFNAAKAQQKPIVLLFFANWCPHCMKFSTLFHDAKIIDLTKRFVMVRVDVDKNKSISAKHAPDGNYIPRVYFLSSALQADLSIQAPRPSYKYFYDERSPGGDTPPGSFALSLEKAAQRLR